MENTITKPTTPSGCSPTLLPPTQTALLAPTLPAYAQKETFGTRETGPATRAVHAGQDSLPVSGGSHGLVPPLDFSVAFMAGPTNGLRLDLDSDESEPACPTERYVYARYAHPTGDHCAAALAALEGAESCLLTTSGMAAISTTLLALLSAGDHVIAPRSVYASTRNLLQAYLPSFGISVTFVDGRDTEAFLAARRPETRLVWLESPSNPMLYLTDMAAVAKWANAEGLLTVADNTFATPLGAQPLTMGVKVVIHSATKYLAGHGDLLAGAILTDQRTAERISPWLSLIGCGLSAHGAWLLRRGISTFPLRMERHCRSAQVLSAWLADHPGVSAVYYPGLESHPQHNLARRQMPGGFGGVVSFEVAGDGEAALRVLENVRLCARAVSLGEPRTLIAHPATMHYADVPCRERLAMGVTENLLRLAVGLEDAADIAADLNRALAAV